MQCNLFKKKESLEDKIELKRSFFENNLTQDDKEIFENLFNLNPKIHKIQKKLKNNYESIDDLVSDTNIVIESELVSEKFDKRNFDLYDYIKLSEKIKFTGRKLNKRLVKEIKKAGTLFKKNYNSFKINYKIISLETLEGKREELNKQLNNYFKLNILSMKRNLSFDLTSQENTIFSNYQDKFRKINEIEDKIQTLYQEFDKVDPEVENNFKNYVLKISRDNFLFKGALTKECKEIDYIEGLKKLENLRSLVKNIEEIKETQNNLEAYIVHMEKIIEEKDYESMIKLRVHDFKYENIFREKIDQYDFLFKEAKSILDDYKQKEFEKSKKINSENYKTYIESDPYAVTFGYVDGGSNKYFSLRGLVQTLGYPKDQSCKKLRRLMFNEDGYDEEILFKLNSYVEDLNNSEIFVEDQKSLSYFESIYFGVKESLKSGIFTNLRKKENESLIESTLNNFEIYLIKSRALIN